jgi:hypothetical protein
MVIIGDVWRQHTREMLLAHDDDLSEELAYLLGNGRTTRLAALAQAPPVVTNSLAVPDADCAGLDTGERFLPTRPEAREPGSEQAIRRPEPRSVDHPLIDGHLMPQGHVLQLEGFPRAER